MTFSDLSSAFTRLSQTPSIQGMEGQTLYWPFPQLLKLAMFLYYQISCFIRTYVFTICAVTLMKRWFIDVNDENVLVLPSAYYSTTPFFLYKQSKT